MEANEFYSLPISPLVGNPFAVEWSQDNHVSLITHRGIHVLELVPHPMCIYPTFRFWRTFVYPSEYVPTEPFQKLINSSIWKMGKEDISTLLMQPAITSRVKDRTDLMPRILRVGWSPGKLVETSKCLLAIMTSAGSLEILYKLGSHWLSVWNLTIMWSENVKIATGFDPEIINDRQFQDIKWLEHVNRHLATSFVWSTLFHDSQDSPFAYLVAALRSCEIVVWRIDRITNLAKAKEPILAFKIQLKSNIKIRELLWLDLDNEKHVIFVGYDDGKIHGIQFIVNNGIFQNERLMEYHNHSDRIIPNSIKLTHDTKEWKIIVVAKGSGILAIRVDNNGDLMETRHLRIGGSSITGMTVLNNEKVIISLQSSMIYVAKITKTELSCKKLENDLKRGKVQYLGIARSPNATILVNVTSPNSLHDHMIMREPSTLQMFRLTGDEWSPWDIINTRKVTKVSLYEYWDCLESIRVDAARTSTPSLNLPKIPVELNNLSIHELRIIMWLTLITQVLEKKQILKGVEKIVGEISEAQPLIFILSACEHLRRLSCKKILNLDEKRCISFLRMYIEIYLAGEDDDELKSNPIAIKVTESLAITSHIDSIETESCNLCGEIISELPWTIDVCSAGHKLPRCSISLLQITTTHYRVCPICGRIFHPSLDDEYDETRCLYCDVPAQFDSRIIADSLESVESKFKNLSKLSVILSDTKITDNDNFNGEKIKKRTTDAHTFAVIVDKDDDDSCITETWQEF